MADMPIAGAFPGMVSHTNSNEDIGGQPLPSDHPIGVGGEKECVQYRDLGNAALKSGHADKAEMLYGCALGTASSLELYVKAYLNRAAARLVLKKYDAAAADAQRATELDPDNPKAHFRLAEAYCNLDRYVDAMKCYLRADRLCPNDKKIAAGIKVCGERRKEVEDKEKRAAAAAAAEAARTLDDADDDDDDDDDDEVVDLSIGDARIRHAPPPAATEEASGDDEAIAIRQELAALVQARLECGGGRSGAAGGVGATSTTTAPVEKAPRCRSPEVLDVDSDVELDTEYTYSPAARRRWTWAHDGGEDDAGGDGDGAAATIADAGGAKHADPVSGGMPMYNAATPAPTADAVAKKKSKASMDYSKFEAIANAEGDEESWQEKVRRQTLERAEPEVVAQCEKVHAHFDRDGDGYWNFEEAKAATHALEGGQNELSREAYNKKCELQGLAQDSGWNLATVVMMYAANPEALALLPEHVKFVNTMQFRAAKNPVRDYALNDKVEAFIDGQWKRGVVFQRASPDPPRYDIMWNDGTGTRGVPAEHMRPYSVAYTGPTGLRGEGKRIQPTVTVDARSGVAKHKVAGDAARASASAAATKATVGCELLEDVPERSHLPEDPIARLRMTAERTGLVDEDTGFLSREKLADVLGIRPMH